MPANSSSTKHGKRYQDASILVDREKHYSPEEAVGLTKQTAVANFDESVELHINTNADPRHAEQQIRTVASLPNGTGKTIRVLAFVQGESVSIAREAGVDFIGDEDTIERIEKDGWTEFDVAIATTDMMGKIGRLGRTLGRKGLMPNPRTGTVVQSQDLPRAIQEAKGGRIEIRMDRTGNLHIVVGKASFSDEALLTNIAAALDAISKAKPVSVKGQFFNQIYLTTTMGPSIKLDSIQALGLKVV
jgi:large subunit ribosomal protein L1